MACLGALAVPAHGGFTFVDPGFTQCDLAVQPTGCMTAAGASFDAILTVPDGTVRITAPCDYVFRSFALVAPGVCTTVTPTVIGPSSIFCLARGLDGKHYAVYGGTWTEVAEINITTGAHIRYVAQGIESCGLAVDPLTGDLYTGHLTKIYRIANPGSPTPTVTVFANFTALAGVVDGLAWACDGSYLLAAGLNDNNILKFTRAGVGSVFATLPGGTGPDGICFGEPGTPLYGNAYVNNNNGSVIEIPLANPAGWRTIASGSGLRGDFVTVDPNGNLLCTQGNRIIRLRATGGGAFNLPGSTLCGNMGCSAQASLDCIRSHGIATAVRVGIKFVCNPANPPNARLARTCNMIGMVKKHAPECAALLAALRSMRDYLMTLAVTPDCSGE